MRTMRASLMTLAIGLGAFGCNYYECERDDFWRDPPDDPCRSGECGDASTRPDPDAGTRDPDPDAALPPPDGGPIPGTCASTADCAEGELCVEGACRPDAALCRVDLDCGPGRRCVDAACRPECETDAECPSGTACTDALCTPSVECRDTAECATGERCVDQRCLPECGDDLPCAHPEDVCGLDHVCRPDVAPRPFCTEDADCAESRLCIHGVCRTPCPSGEDDECLAWDSQLVRCGLSDTGLSLCYTRPESDPQCRTSSDCDTGESCIDALCH